MDELGLNRSVQSTGDFNFVKGVGRMFYMIDPKDTLFERVEEVPNFYVQSWPYFLIFIILEHIILKLEGKKGLRINDQLSSLSNGLFLESGRLIWRGAESYAYAWIYSNYKLVDLPWDNVSTWILAAVGVDFFYYWMHRSCHEIHILWAQHQVHHTSEDFNMGVGFRQSALQGWCGFIFYLPLAVAIPPAQFIMHHQFSYLYMFWIHTETIKTLGPLEYILNTPSHHRIHHGSNPYCIDVNYGGVLIIWDKLFGTFRAERNEDRIVYGLIYQQPSFNPLHLQTYYTSYVVQSFKRYDHWFHKVRAVLSRPSWKPGVSTRFKDMEEDPAIHTRKKYNVVLPTWCTIYLLTHYALVLYGFYQLFLIHMVDLYRSFHQCCDRSTVTAIKSTPEHHIWFKLHLLHSFSKIFDLIMRSAKTWNLLSSVWIIAVLRSYCLPNYKVLPQSTVIPLVLYIFGSLSTFGTILDASPKAPLFETIRCMSILILARILTPVLTLPYSVELLYVFSGLFWLLFVCKSDEIKAVTIKAL